MTPTHSESASSKEGISRNPLVSILTPSFNQGQWLADNLRSVACQTYGNTEHIVMDGGSTDGSVELLRATGDFVLWRSEPDDGQAHAINKAFAQSNGEIIGWLNSDDAYFDCRVIEAVVAYFVGHPEAEVVYGHSAQTTAEGLIIQLLWTPQFSSALLRAVDFITQPAAFIRRSAMEHTMLDASFHFAMDYELWLRLESQGRRFARIDRIAAIDRHQPDRKSSTIKGVHQSDLERLARRYDTRFGPEHEAVRTAFYRRQRLAGALLVPRVQGPFAFTTPDRPTEGLLRRQIGSLKSTWPREYQ